MKKLLYTATGLIVALNILDLITTFYVLSIGGVETNPLASFLLAYGLLIPFKLGIVGLIAAGTWIQRNEPVLRKRVIGSCVVALIYLCVVAWNVSRIAVHLQ